VTPECQGEIEAATDVPPGYSKGWTLSEVAFLGRRLTV